MTDDDITKRAAQYMLKRGIIGASGYLELSELSGRSRQIIRHWAKEYPDARSEYLANQWQKALNHASNHASNTASRRKE